MTDDATFAEQVAALKRQGLHPTLVQQLLDHGPEVGRPFVDAATGEAGAELIAAANDAQAALDEVSTELAIVARAAAHAIAAGDSGPGWFDRASGDPATNNTTQEENQ